MDSLSSDNATVNLLLERNHLIIHAIYFNTIREPLACKVTLQQLRLSEDLSAVKGMHIPWRIDRIISSPAHANKDTQVTEEFTETLPTQSPHLVSFETMPYKYILSIM